MENFQDPETGAMDIKKRHLITHFSELILSGTIATVCKLADTTITTNELEGTSLVNTMEGEVKPEGGTVYATITLQECSSPGLNGSYPITGTAKGIGDGATVESTTTSAAGLRLGRQAVTVTGKATPRMTPVKRQKDRLERQQLSVRELSRPADRTHTKSS